MVTNPRHQYYDEYCLAPWGLPLTPMACRRRPGLRPPRHRDPGDKDLKALVAELSRLRSTEGTQALADHFTAKAVNIGQRHATAADAQQGLQDLIANRKMTSRDQDGVLVATAKLPGLEAGAKGAIEKASKAAWHSSKSIAAFREWLAWLFAVGLIGLGMQITVKSLKQAGGKPLIIGGIVGTLKAVGSLIVVLLFVREFI